MPSPLQAARALRKTIDAGARTTDGATSVVADETVEAMTQAGLYGIMAPREVGGAELPLVEAIDVLAEVARADGSAGWCLMANASTVSLFGAYLDDAFIDEMFGAGVPRVAFGTNYGTAQPEDGGYRISGRYAFGSGIAHARWIGAGLIHPADPEQILFCALPADQAKILGNWDVMGLQETGSFDYAVNDVWVPEAATFPFVSPVRRRGGPVFELGVIPLTAAAHAGFAIGVVRRALDELAALARCKQRFGAASTLAENERFLPAPRPPGFTRPMRARRTRSSARASPIRPMSSRCASPPCTSRRMAPTWCARPTCWPARRPCAPGRLRAASATSTRERSTTSRGRSRRWSSGASSSRRPRTRRSTRREPPQKR
jgi:hypothetical protein